MTDEQGLGQSSCVLDTLTETTTDRHKFQQQHDLFEPTCCQIRCETVTAPASIKRPLTSSAKFKVSP